MRLRQVPIECARDYEDARGIAREHLASLRTDASARRRERVAARLLAVEWFAILAVTYGLIYARWPAWLKLALLIPWSLYASLALDNITHYANHWPLFRSRLGNALWHASAVFVLFNPLEIKQIHSEHHRAYSSTDGDERAFGDEERGRSFWRWLLVQSLDSFRLLLPFRPMEPCVRALRQSHPAQFRALVATRWAHLVWTLVLLGLAPRSTLLYFVPFVLVLGSAASLIMNLTDHIPGDPHHPFRLATCLEPRGPIESALSAVNHHTAATHLTHHLFPSVHWVHLRALQSRLAPIYARNGAPRSLMVNSTLVGNPLALWWVLRQIDLRRFEPPE